MKVAYISHHQRPCYEYEWFSRIPAETIRFIDTDFSKYPKEKNENIEYCKVDYIENKFFNKIFHSTASIVKYRNFETYLKDVDVVIVLEVFSSLSKQIVSYCKKKNIKVVALVYELIPTHPIYYLPTHILNKKYVIKNADAFICVSKKAEDHLLKLGADQTKTTVVYPGIDLSVFVPKINKSNEELRRLLFVGKLDVHKGIDLCLSMYKEIVKKDPQVELYIVGTGSYREQVEVFANKYKNVTYFGSVPNKDLPEIINRCGIYIMPARDTYKLGMKIGSEQFGFSLVEAMACGLDIISSKCGAIPEIITDSNIVVDQDSDALVSTVWNSLEKERVEFNKTNVRITQTSYDINKQAEAFDEYLDVIVNKNVE